jgi:V/A-type H+/Na+-transporting ATPase subunit C
VTGYDYGNARLRARRAALLRREQYAGLANRDLPGLVTALAATSYRPQAEAAADGGGGKPELLNRIARDHLIAALTGISGFYRGQAWDVVTALLGRFDVHAVLTVLRARHHGTPPEAACALLVPAGRLSAETTRQAAREPDLPAAARFLAARRLPDSDTAAALVSAQRRYEIDADLAHVEKTVTRSAHAHQITVLAAAGPEAGPALAALRRETDDLNLLLALRLREPAAGATGAAGGEGDGDAYLPGGAVPLPLLSAIRRAPARADVVAAAGPAHRAWHGLLGAWAESGDLAALHAGLESERLCTQLRVLRGGDPLSAAPVLHYVLAHQAQARNLRLLAQAAVGAVSHEEARCQLVTAI